MAASLVGGADTWTVLGESHGGGRATPHARVTARLTQVWVTSMPTRS